MNGLNKQQGSVLIISLLLLIVTTLLGLSSMNNTIMEEKMAGNLRQQNIALQSAESALREAEAWLAGLNKNTRPDAEDDDTSDIWIKDGVEDGPGVPSEPTGMWWANDGLWGYAITYANTAGVTELNNAVYLIEELEPVSDTITVGQQQDVQSVRDYFRITARGQGTDQRATSYLRSSFSRRF